MKRIIFIINILLFLISKTAFGQIVNVDRSPDLNLSWNCQSQLLTYIVSISPGGTTLNGIVVSESFAVTGCTDCYDLQIITQPTAGSVNLIGGGTGIEFNVPTVTLATTYSFHVQITPKNNGTLSTCTFCTDGPMVTSPTPVTINSSINGIPSTRECVGLKAKNRWTSTINNGCVIQSGLNCYRYPVVISSRGCDQMDLTGVAKFNFSTLSGANITGVTPTSGNMNLASSISANTSQITITPSGGPPTFDVNNVYTFYVDVEYPCGIFPANNTTPVTATLSNSLISFPNVGLSKPTECPSPLIIALGGYSIPGNSVSHTLNELETDAQLTISRAYPLGHDAAGCSNRYDIALTNTGNSILQNILVEMDPIPSNIELSSVCGPVPVAAYKINNGSWQNGSPSQAVVNQVTGVQWRVNQVNPGIQCDTIPPRQPSPVMTLCYNILSGTPLGTNIDACVRAQFGQTVACFAPGCNQPVPGPSFPLPMQACHDFDVTIEEAVPRISKTVSPTIRFPGQVVDFDITVSNCGAANLITQIQDNFPPQLTNVTIVGYDRYQFQGGTGTWTSGPGSWLTSPASIVGNQVAIDVDIPGICEMNLNGVCCKLTCNKLVVKLQAEVDTCIKALDIVNTASLFPQTTVYDDAILRILNYNQLVLKKEAKGDLSAVFSTNTNVSIGGPIDYRVVIKNRDPQNWYDPVVVDVLPDIAPGRLFCGNTVPQGQFSVKLRNALTVADIDLSGVSQGNITSASNYTISYGPLANNYNDPAYCGLPSTINLPYSGTNNRALRIQFNGYLGCEDSIVIHIPAEVIASTAANGEVATNRIFKTERLSPTAPYLARTQEDADAYIKDWQPKCCDSTSVIAQVTSIGTVTDQGTHYRVPVDFFLQTASPIPTQKIRASIIDFKFVHKSPDCFKCQNKFQYLGTYPWWGAPNIGNLVNVSNPPLPYSGNRERIWEGPPTNLSGGLLYGIWFQIPKSLNLTCCKGIIELCMKFEFTDGNCNTCDTVTCFRIQQP